jgi:Ca2+-binding EF-hand superfamily protein
LHSAILQTFYGVSAAPADDDAKKKKKQQLTWNVFEDVFSTESSHQRSVWMSSFNASHSNLTSEKNDDRETHLLSPSVNHKYLSWADALLDSSKNALNEQRLYLKFVFRRLDKTHRGYVSRQKFITAMKCIDKEHDGFLQDEQLEQLADAFTVRRRNPAVGNEAEESGNGSGSADADAVEYTSFLKSLRVVDAETHSPSRRRLHSASSVTAMSTINTDAPPPDLDEDENPFFM